ncbi:hypothetical protein ScPMuIL_002461 [Solemya velum]
MTPVIERKDDIFGGDITESVNTGKSLYFVRALSYCDINKIEMDELKEILTTYPDFSENFMGKFQVTFNLQRGTLLQRKFKSKVDDETLRFIRQKRPRMQCKRRNAETEGRLGIRGRRREGSDYMRADTSPGDDDGPGIVEFTTDAATEDIDIIADDSNKHTDVARKSSMSSIAGAVTNLFGKGRRDKHCKECRPLLPSSESVSRHDGLPDAQPSHRGLSPITSSVTSYTPKSSSSTGQLWRLSNVDLEIQQHPDKGNIHCLSDIDSRLEGLHTRMRNFENELCTTVDTILEILGQKPKVTRELFEQSCTVPRWDRATRPKGPRLVKTPSELDRVLENM